MTPENFKTLEKKVKKPNFGEDYKSLNIILRILSFLGNFASIFLASFFVTELLSVAIDNPIIYWVIAIISLAGLEATKREIFHRFSRDFIRTNKIFTSAVLPMLIFTMTLISLSFYSSLSGAQKFSSKSDQLEVVAETEIDNFTDSTMAYYQEKIDLLETQNKELFEANQRIDQQIQDLLDEHPTWTNSAKRLRDGKEPNIVQIEKNDLKIKEIKKERDQVIEDYEKDVLTDTSEDIEKNKSDSNVFIGTSTLIEFLILIGIYFNNLYNFRTYRDNKLKLLNDENYKTYFDYYELLEVMFLNNKEKDTIPGKDLIKNLLLMNKVYLTDEQIDNAYSLFTALKIIESNGEHEYFIKDKEEAIESLKKHFNQ
jgi:hypothetical protein